MSKSCIGVLKTNPKTVLKDIHALFELTKITEYLDPSIPLILKDNISWHFPFLSSNTTPWQLEGVILALKERGFKKIVAVHNNTVVTNPYKGLQLNKLDVIYKKYNIKELCNFIPSDIRWVKFKPKSKLLVLPEIFPEGIRIPEYFIGKNILHLPTIKTHIYTTITGSMKNAFGGLLDTKRHYTHSVIHSTLVDLLSIQKEIHPGIFTLTDGTICGNGAGPRTMQPVVKNYLLAGADSVAIDAIAAKMMGFNPKDIPFIRIAHEQGLGQADLKDIDLKGESIDQVNFRFAVKDNLTRRFAKIIWYGPLKKIQHLFFKTKLVYIFIFASYIYHDYIWWNFIGKRIQNKLKKSTDWGKLFDEY